MRISSEERTPQRDRKGDSQTRNINNRVHWSNVGLSGRVRVRALVVIRAAGANLMILTADPLPHVFMHFNCTWT
jgi:hypothetical protein